MTVGINPESDNSPVVVEKKSRFNLKIIGGVVASIIAAVVVTLIVREIMSDDDSSAIIEEVQKSLENVNVEDVTSS